MRKNINKLVAVAIGVSIMSGSAIPAFAAGTATTNNTSAQNTSTITSVQVPEKTKPVLTLKNAIAAGISNSDTIALQVKKINLEEDKLEMADEFEEADDSDDNEYQKDKQELAVRQEKENKENLEDQIAQLITDQYNNIVAKEKELNKLKKEIEIRTKEFKDTELRKKLGMKTSIELKNEEIKIETLKNNEKAKENQLKNIKDYFKVLTNADLSKYALVQDADYEVFKINGSVDNYLDNKLDKYFKYEKQSSELLKDYLKDNKVGKPDDAPDQDNYSDSTDADGNVTKSAEDKYEAALAGYNAEVIQYRTYLEQRYGSSAAAVGLEEKRKSYKKILNESYASLLDLENKINVMKSSTAVDNKQLSIAKLKYDMGLITKTEYNKQVLSLDKEDLEVTLRTYIDNYNKLKNYIQKPWLISGGSGAGEQ